jgi:flagellar export protein FliJ
MPPKFSLQAVLDFRHMRVEILEVELGKLLQTKQHARAFLEALHNSRSRILQQIGESQNGEIDMFIIARLYANIDTVNERIIQQEARLVEISKQVVEKQQELIQAKQDDEALETLKDQEIERFEIDKARGENRLLDDIYISKAFHRSNSVA